MTVDLDKKVTLRAVVEALEIDLAQTCDFYSNDIEPGTYECGVVDALEKTISMIKDGTLVIEEALGAPPTYTLPEIIAFLRRELSDCGTQEEIHASMVAIETLPDRLEGGVVKIGEAEE